VEWNTTGTIILPWIYWKKDWSW